MVTKTSQKLKQIFTLRKQVQVENINPNQITILPIVIWIKLTNLNFLKGNNQMKERQELMQK